MLNEINPDKACKICGAEFDIDNNQFIVRCGKPINPEEFAGKVCYFAKKRKAIGCINNTQNDNPSWETFQGLDSKSEKVLEKIGVSPEDILYLKQNGQQRYE